MHDAPPCCPLPWTSPPASQKAEQPKQDQKPSSTLFVVNFDVMKTRIRDLEDHYDRFGRLRRVDIKRNFAFIEFDR